MAIFIPEGTLIGQGTVGDSDVIVMVIGGEWTTVVVCHRVTLKDRLTDDESAIKLWFGMVASF